jgi:hypothetical protein
MGARRGNFRLVSLSSKAVMDWSIRNESLAMCGILGRISGGVMYLCVSSVFLLLYSSTSWVPVATRNKLVKLFKIQLNL